QNSGPWAAAMRKVSDMPSVSSTFLRIEGGVQHIAPQITGSGGRYAIAYAASSTSQAAGATTNRTGYGLEVQRINWPHGGTPVELPVQRLKNRAGASLRQWRATGMAFDYDTASHWLVTYVSDRFSSG